LSACQRATARALASSSFSPDLSQLVRRVDSPSSHASRPPAKKADFTRNRTRPTTKSHPFPLPKTHTKATGDDGGDFRCAEKKKGEIRPAGTISREGMRYLSLRFPVSLHLTRNKSLGAGMHSPWHVFPPIAPLREAVFRALVCSHVVSENPLLSPQHRIRTCSNQRLICLNGSVACL